MGKRNEKGKITALYVYGEKGTLPKRVSEVRVSVESGLEGDRHGSETKRKVSILSEEVRDWMQEQKEQGLCFEKFKENIRVQGLDLQNIQEGDLLCTEQVCLKVTGIFKKCYPDVCTLAASGRECRLKEQGIFAAVVKEGILKEGEIIR